MKFLLFPVTKLRIDKFSILKFSRIKQAAAIRFMKATTKLARFFGSNNPIIRF